jgi:hypothetical protein
VKIDHSAIVHYWASAPVSKRRPGFFNFNSIPFPDLARLTPAEKDLLRPILAAHPEYLANGEIWCDGRVQ